MGLRAREAPDGAPIVKPTTVASNSTAAAVTRLGCLAQSTVRAQSRRLRIGAHRLVRQPVLHLFRQLQGRVRTDPRASGPSPCGRSRPAPGEPPRLPRARVSHAPCRTSSSTFPAAPSNGARLVKQCIQGRAQTVHVRRRTQLVQLSRGLLRAHEGRGADRDTRDRLRPIAALNSAATLPRPSLRTAPRPAGRRPWPGPSPPPTSPRTSPA